MSNDEKNIATLARLGLIDSLAETFDELPPIPITPQVVAQMLRGLKERNFDPIAVAAYELAVCDGRVGQAS